MLFSIQTKITLIAVCFALALASSLTFVIFSLQENLHRDLVTSNINQASSNINLQIARVWKNTQRLEKIKLSLQSLDLHENIRGACVFDNTEGFLVGYSKSEGFTQVSPSSTCFDLKLPYKHANTTKGTLKVFSNTLQYSGKDEGKLLLFVDENRSINSVRFAFFKQAASISVLICILLGLLFLLILKRQFSPLVGLKDFTERVAQRREYTARYSVNGKNEISLLGESINKMIGNIVDELDGNIEKTKQLSRQQKQMEKLANFDSLTGLPNRQYVMEHIRTELARAQRDNKDLIVMFFDLDGFKSINDTLGHDVGDKILQAVAERFKSHLRTGDTIARLGGDEFLLVPFNTAQDEAVALIAHKIITAMEAPFQENGLDLHLGVSIGIARASQANYNLSELISYSDIAMYESKKAGKGQFTLFNPNMVEGHKRKLSVANGIPTALANDEFYIVYQPKVNREARIVGFEALLRWSSPELGEVAPSEFIEIAESSGKVHEITFWVIRQVFEDVGKLVRQFGDEIKVSLNLSTLDLMHPNLMTIIEGNRQNAQVEAKNVEFEVTESAYLENFKDANRLFSDLSKKGYFVALDDFGTGFSSLGYLAQISINTLKIDKQFVLRMEESKKTMLVTRTIISLAKRLNLTVCAEGIENYSTFSTLVKEDCDTFQGYWFSKPATLAQALALPNTLITYTPRP